MLICHCKAISDQKIRQLTAAGAASCRDVARGCSAGTECGGCIPAIREMLQEGDRRNRIPTPRDRSAQARRT